MAGERTPDITAPGSQRGSDDEISLREHLQRQLDSAVANLHHRIDDEHTFAASQREALRVILDERHKALLLQLDERYAAQEKAQSIAYEAHRMATDTAFANAEGSIRQALTATEKAIVKVEHALDERFASQATALDKAERATEKRFESVNEFRQQLNDQAHTFMPRTESVSRHERNTENMDKIEQHFQQDIAAINKRLDTMQGIVTGQQLQRTEGRSNTTDTRAWLAFGITVVLMILTIAGFVIANAVRV